MEVVSIFKLMSTPENTKQLTVQYRMNEVIMSLANKLVYKNSMTCSPERMKSTIELPKEKLVNFLDNAETLKSKISWILEAVCNDLEKSVMFLDTSKLDAFDTKTDDSTMNVIEASIVEDLVTAFVEVSC